MSIADKLSRLSDARDDIITALAGKGVTATGHGFEDFPDDIDSIQQGGSSGGISKTIAADAYTFDIEDDDGSKLVTYGLNEANAVMDLGNTYKVTYNNTEYTCVAGTSSSGDVGVGSLTYSFTDYPFFITTSQSGGIYSGWWAVKRGNGGLGYKTIKVEEVEEGFFTAETLNVSANGTYNAPTGKVYDKVIASIPSGIGTLLKTYSMGSISTTNTQAADTGKTITGVDISDGYDLLIVETSVNSVTNNRHTATVGLIFLTASSTVDTKNGATVVSNKWNSKISSSGVTTTRQNTTAYGIYPYSCTINNESLSISMYQRYNSTQTGTINGNYTTRVYGVKLYDLIGG